MPKWTDDDTRRYVELTGRLPSPLPDPVFQAVSQLFVGVAYELIILRKNGETIEVLLTKRPDNDPHWPGEWHYPGTMHLPGDQREGDALTRLMTNEVPGGLQGTPTFIGKLLVRSKRGPAMQHLYLGRPDSQLSEHGTFFDVMNLPEPFIDVQRAGLAMVVEAFKNME